MCHAPMADHPPMAAAPAVVAVPMVDSASMDSQFRRLGAKIVEFKRLYDGLVDAFAKHKDYTKDLVMKHEKEIESLKKKVIGKVVEAE
ncbi:hypothetical protein L6452_03594 [Arctium lappa]|uniref:Uncharacterized protein n=1 Tax=Arctium lappa TaxID=4217 RepID=A0ACB9FN86_ARCLA|nr:hypothetical protein L6452_03594 [Arctium lappa]